MIQADMKNKERRHHPTQKPVALYRWLLANYATLGMKILDTHLGSMSSAIACHYAGMHLTGCEIDADYFREGMERVKRETAQKHFFKPMENYERITGILAIMCGGAIIAIAFTFGDNGRWLVMPLRKAGA